MDQIDQTEKNYDQKAHQDTETQDISTFNFQQSNYRCLAQKLDTKYLNANARYFLSKIKEFNKRKIKDKQNLALILAERMPPNIKDQVVKIINYYQQHMRDQLSHIHTLVRQNHDLKKQVQSLSCEQQNKENNSNMRIAENNYCNKSQIISQLQQCLMDKNKQIVNLNKQITDLLSKNKKYKKRVYELQSKSPMKSTIQNL